MPKVTSGDWTLGGIAITVEEDSEDFPNIRMGELGVLDSLQTVLHYGGTSAMNREITFVSFSGYESNILPLVGSGYHALVSDFGSEGNYFVKSLSPTRLQDLRCYESGVAIYRCRAELIKESLSAVPTDRMIVGTKTDGLYYCSNVTYDGTDPEWTLLDGNHGIQALSVDENDPLAVQIIVSETDGGVYGRGTEISSSYVSILTEAQALALAQNEEPALNAAEIFNVAYNSYYDNRVHVIFRAWQGISKGGIYLATANNYGQGSWTLVETEYFGFANYTDGTGGAIMVSPVSSGTYTRGYTVWASCEFSNGDSHTISTDGGDSFASGVDTGTGSFVANLYVDKFVQGKIWTQGDGNTNIGTCTNYSPSSYANVGPLLTAPQSNPIISSVFQDSSDADNIAVAYSTSLKYSVNGAVGFTSVNGPTHGNSDNNLTQINGHSWAKIAIGTSQNGSVSDSWSILWGTPNLGTTFYSLAGSDPENNADGKSIPYDCGGIGAKGIVCWNA